MKNTKRLIEKFELTRENVRIIFFAIENGFSKTHFVIRILCLFALIWSLFYIHRNDKDILFNNSVFQFIYDFQTLIAGLIAIITFYITWKNSKSELLHEYKVQASLFKNQTSELEKFYIKELKNIIADNGKNIAFPKKISQELVHLIAVESKTDHRRYGILSKHINTLNYFLENKNTQHKSYLIYKIVEVLCNLHKYKMSSGSFSYLEYDKLNLKIYVSKSALIPRELKDVVINHVDNFRPDSMDIAKLLYTIKTF